MPRFLSQHFTDTCIEKAFNGLARENVFSRAFHMSVCLSLYISLCLSGSLPLSVSSSFSPLSLSFTFLLLLLLSACLRISLWLQTQLSIAVSTLLRVSVPFQCLRPLLEGCNLWLSDYFRRHQFMWFYRSPAFSSNL